MKNVRRLAPKMLGVALLPHFVSALLFLGPALSIVATSIYPTLGFGLSMIGLYFWHTHSGELSAAGATSIRKPFLAVWCLIIFGVVMVLQNVAQSERWGAYHIAIAIFLFWPAYFACAIPGVNPRALWAGAAVGAISAIALACYQVFILGDARAAGLTNPIPFGNISLILATGSLIGLIRSKAQSAKPVETLLYVAGGLAGIGASLLSGTKSGWLSLLVVAFVGYQLFPLKVAKWKKWLSALCVVATLGIIVTLPQIPVKSRLISMWDGFHSWSSSGDITEGSIGPRLEMWKFGLAVAFEKPVFGLGKEGMMARKQQAIDQENFDPMIEPFATLHNEFLNMWVTKGLAGTLALCAVFGGVFVVFFRLRKSASWQLKSISLMGTSLVLMFLEFGVGEIALMLNSYRHVFLFWVFALAGLAFRLLEDESLPANTVQPWPSRIS